MKVCRVNYFGTRAEFLEWHQIPPTDKLPKQIARGCQLWPFFPRENRERDLAGKMGVYGRKAAKN